MAPVPVSDDLCRVLTAAQDLSRRTKGEFDVTVGMLTRLWRRARRQHEFPDAELLREARAATGFRNLVVDPKRATVELKRPGMRLDLGAIAKGYVADVALAVLRDKGIRAR